jgi:hypothetical protein
MLVHIRVAPASMCDVSSAPVLALEAQLPTGCPSHQTRRHACPRLALEAQGDSWRCRRIAWQFHEPIHHLIQTAVLDEWAFKAVVGSAEAHVSSTELSFCSR